MIITEELAQKIVDSAMCLVHRNVNIMNREGFIIATGHPHRLNTFHKGAKDVIESGAIIEIYPHELSLYPGALQGVNLPIIMDEQIVGVVGVFGNPDEVRDTGRLVKLITELILDRELMQIEVHSKNRLREQFIDIVLTGFSSGPQPRIKRIAKTLGINLSLPRAFVLVDASEILKVFNAEYGSSELLLERSLDMFYQQLIEHNLITGQDIMVMHNEQIVILKTFPCDLTIPDLKQWSVQMIAVLSSQREVNPRCGIGALGSTLSEYAASYKQAAFCLTHCTNSNPVNIIYSGDLLIRFAFDDVLQGPAATAFRILSDDFKNCLERRPEYRSTLQFLLDNNLDLNLTSESLHIHRNTLLYRLGRFKEDTNLDPLHLINDAFLCRLLLDNFMKPS